MSKIQFSSKPGKLHSAFNPVVFDLEITSLSTEKPLGSMNMLAVLSIDDKEIEFKKPVVNNSISFDFTEHIKHFLSVDYEAIEEVDRIKSTYVDYFIVFKLDYYEEADDLAFSGRAYSGTVKRGVRNEIEIDRFGTDFKSLKKYEGYELRVGMILSKGMTVGKSFLDVLEAEGETVNAPLSIDVNDDDSSVYITDEASNLPLFNSDKNITDNTGRLIFVHNVDSDKNKKLLYVDAQCTPNSPFYVRWINRHGFFDYYMFANNTQTKTTIDNKIFTELARRPNELYARTKQLLDFDESTKCKVGAQVNRNDFECLKRLIYSPIAEKFDRESGKWFQVDPVDVEIVDNSNKDIIEVFFEFEMFNEVKQL